MQMSLLHNTCVPLVYVSNFMTDAFYTFGQCNMRDLHTSGL
jgi:hypothetical protein